MRTMKAPIDRAIDAAGNLTELAKRLKVTPQVVVNWRSRGIPAERVLDVERATADPETGDPRVTCHELCPEVFGKQAA